MNKNRYNNNIVKTMMKIMKCIKINLNRIRMMKNKMKKKRKVIKGYNR